MSDVFDEVEENLRREQYEGFFKKNWLWLVLALVAILGSVGAWQGYKAYTADQAAKYSDKLEQGSKILESRDFAAAERYLVDMAKSAPPAYKSSALTLAGTALLEQGDAKGALAHFDEAASAVSTPVLRDAARMKAAYVAADLEDLKAIETRLKPIIDDGGPLSYQARELLGAKAYESGDLAKAREQFQFLSLALEAPEGLRNRARSNLSVVGAEPAKAATPAAPAAAPAKSGDPK